MGERSAALDRAGSWRTRSRTRRISGLAALTLAVVLALVGCDGDGSGGGSSAASGTTTDPPATAAPTTQASTTTTKPAGERIPVLSGNKASKSDIRWVQQHLARWSPEYAGDAVHGENGRRVPRFQRVGEEQDAPGERARHEQQHADLDQAS